ncbi:MAG: (Fe-S)-binding protein [Odoribacter sp.]|nr:(Fe-S)-binding protein [Odoribacter sp.]
MESLVHRKIYKTNPFLGYMHMCFALGWFLLIVVGKTESMVYHTSLMNPPYFAIFFRFFHPAKETFPYSGVFAFIMDFILLFILTGLFLAILKRVYSRIIGMKKTTKHRPYDILILTVLWLIFPLRFLAESFTSGSRGGGSFLTNNAGNFFAEFLPIDSLIYTAWWAYSIALGLFFILLPFSRYMHIPTEMVYIFLKNWGVKLDKESSGFEKMQIYSCSRCGICIDRCQLNTALKINDTQAVYYLKKIRHKKEYKHLTENCLMCGRCESACPVSIDLNQIRLNKRQDIIPINKDTYNYINIQPPQKTKIAYFAGCMSHLTPTIIRSMLKIFKNAQVDYTFIDEKQGICCGRPMKLSGNLSASEVLTEKNKKIIQESGAEMLITSCPICYKTFKEDYNLNIPILHHTEYIHQLIQEGSLKTRPSSIKTVFHNPCELGRGNDIYKEPLETLRDITQMVETRYEGKNALCCGGSLANNYLSVSQRSQISQNTLQSYASSGAGILVTACPMCKKTFNPFSHILPVKDIAEIVAENSISC